MTGPTILCGGLERPLGILEPHPLVASHNVYIEALTAATIRHAVYLTLGGARVMVVGNRGSFLSQHVWVETSLVEEGMIDTYVWNMSNATLVIRKGVSVSHLLALGVVEAKRRKG